MTSLVDTVVAKSPVPIIAIVALPVASIGKCFARIAEDAALQTILRVLFASKHMRRSRRSGKRR